MFRFSTYVAIHGVLTECGKRLHWDSNVARGTVGGRQLVLLASRNSIGGAMITEVREAKGQPDEIAEHEERAGDKMIKRGRQCWEG